jgi:Uma2 family endonuclease
MADDLMVEAQGTVWPPAPAWVPRRKLTVTDYHRMGEAGVFAENERVELLNGELIAMAPVGSGHSGTVNRLNRLLVRLSGDNGIVAVQNPIRLDNFSEPQPDFAVLRPRADDYMQSTPEPNDVLLVIEVAEASLRYDRNVKRAAYARAGVQEYWIVDLFNRQMEVCRSPNGDQCGEITIFGRDATVTLQDISIPLSLLFSG